MNYNQQWGHHMNVQEIFALSQSTQAMGEVATVIAKMDKKPSTLRALCDFVSKERKGDNAALFENNDIGRNNAYVVAVSWLYIQPGLNIRHRINIEHAEMFKSLYINDPSKVPPMSVKVVIVDGVTRLKIIEGHHRFTGLMSAILEGSIQVDKILIEEFTGNAEDEVYKMINSANSLKLHPIDRAVGFSRLEAWGHSVDKIAAGTGVDKVTVRRGLILAKAGESVKQLVLDDKVSADVVIDLMIECQGTERCVHDELVKALQKAKNKGKQKITARFVSSRNNINLKPKVIRKTFSALLPTLEQIRTQITPEIEVGNKEPDNVILTVTPEVARQLMNALTQLQESQNDEKEGELVDESEVHSNQEEFTLN